MSRRTWLLLTLLCLVVMAAFAGQIFSGQALAQGNPFGAGRAPGAAPPPPAADGIVGWLFAKQAEFYRAFPGLVRAAKADGSAVWGLLGVSFLYGVFHAVGPGHGKAVISSYLVANNETWRRGVVLSFASAMLQAAVAVAVVGIAAALFGATASVMKGTARWIEIASYALIVLLGARLVWSKGRAFASAWRAMRAPRLAPVGAAVTPHDHHDHAHHHAHHHDHGHDHHGHAHDDRHHHTHAHTHAHGDSCEVCGHSHGPEPEVLGGPGGWQRGLSAIFAVGLRPCSGAILVLVFSLAQELFWAGVAAAFVMGIGTAISVAAIATLTVTAKDLAVRLASGSGGYGTLTARGLEVAAAMLVLAFGLLLLTGYILNEPLGLA